MILSRAARVRPRSAMALGALGVATSGIFVGLSGTSPGTATFFRCLLALPLLWPLIGGERRHEGGLPWRRGAVAVVAGVLFAADAMWWTQAIFEVGAGVTAVLVNAQVVIVPLLSLLVDREPLRRGFVLVLPFMVVGIVLTGGGVRHRSRRQRPAAGNDPRGARSAVLLGIPLPAAPRRTHRTAGPVLPPRARLGRRRGHHRAPWQGVTLPPGWAALGWLALTAVCGQVCGWLLIALAASHLDSTTSAAVLMLTPAGALALSALVLGEQPTVPQLLGCALVLASAYAASSPRNPSAAGRPRSVGIR